MNEDWIKPRGIATTQRIDGLHRKWICRIKYEFREYELLSDIIHDLYQIPITPLPDPHVSGNERWDLSLNVSDYPLADEWAEYIRVLRGYGQICQSRLGQIKVPEECRDAPPRGRHGFRVITKLLPDEWTDDLFLWATVYATGRVECYVVHQGPDSDFPN